MTIALIVLGVIVGVYGAYVALVAVMATKVMFPGGPEVGAIPSHPKLERLEVNGVEAFFFSSGAHQSPAVIFAHGNGETIDLWVDEFDFYLSAGVSVLLIEYRGYGRSAGRPAPNAIVDDAEQFLELLEKRPEVDPARIIFHGRSIGSGVLCGLAKRRKPYALIIESGFTSLTPMLNRFGAPGFVLGGAFNNIDVVRSLDVPLLVLHGERDEVFPVEMAREMAASSTRSTLKLYPCGHNDCDRHAIERDVTAFLRSLPARDK
jgi:pimeloyl-ACP methyl ester carboxylesterase